MNESYFYFNEPVQKPLEAWHSLPALDSIPILRSLEHRWYLSTPVLVTTFFTVLYLRWLSKSSGPVVKGPVAGYRISFEPTFLLRFRFIFNAVKIMNDGYNKFKDVCYVIRRMDTDVTVIPLKYLDELRKSGRDELNGTNANIDNVLGKYTHLDEMRHNDQFLKIITHCLNPNINEFMKEAQDELNYAFKADMPDFQANEWLSVDIHTLLRRMISRIASRLMLGLPNCRNETMVSITESHTIAIFAVALILRRFPPILHPIVSWLIPYKWVIQRNVRDTKKITQPILESYLESKARGDAEDASKKPMTLFNWMVDNAKPHQSSLDSLVAVQLAVTVAAVYTSSQVTSHMLVFLAAHPEIIEELRKEISEQTDDIEKIDASKLHKMDACLAETLRLNPPLTNAPQRRAMQDVILKDGTVIPQGALVAFPCFAAASDPSLFSEPQQFRVRPEALESPVTTPRRNHLAFGWGTQACPGRFLAAKEIKMIVARLISEYDISLAPSATKMRKVYDIEDLRVMNPSMRILMRRRPSA